MGIEVRFIMPCVRCAVCGAEVMVPFPPPKPNLLDPRSRLRCAVDAMHEHGVVLRMEARR